MTEFLANVLGLADTSSMSYGFCIEQKALTTGHRPFACHVKNTLLSNSTDTSAIILVSPTYLHGHLHCSTSHAIGINYRNNSAPRTAAAVQHSGQQPQFQHRGQQQQFQHRG